MIENARRVLNSNGEAAPRDECDLPTDEELQEGMQAMLLQDVADSLGKDSCTMEELFEALKEVNIYENMGDDDDDQSTCSDCDLHQAHEDTAGSTDVHMAEPRPIMDAKNPVTDIIMISEDELSDDDDEERKLTEHVAYLKEKSGS